MPPKIDLDPYKDEIEDLISQKTTQAAIRTILRDKYDIIVSRTSLQTCLSNWQVISLSSSHTNRVDIRDRVEELLPFHNTRDILRILTVDGTPSSERTIRRIRGDLGIKLRLSPEEREQQLSDIEAILISEAQIETVYHLLRPDAIEGRLPGRRRERVNYISPGPNDVWHVDGHMKLEPFGIEIYAAIDGYSR
ncbi:hypothetical protein E8E15_001690, partial [Penicillium rubens]